MLICYNGYYYDNIFQIAIKTCQEIYVFKGIFILLKILKILYKDIYRYKDIKDIYI